MLSTWLPHCRRAWRKRSRGNAALPDGSDPPPFIAAAALDVANPLHMDGGIGVQFPSLLNSRILRRLDGKRLFHAAAEDRIAVLVLFDKEVFVVIAHKMLMVWLNFNKGTKSDMEVCPSPYSPRDYAYVASPNYRHHSISQFWQLDSH